MVAITGVEPVLLAVKAAILPVPLPARPIDVVLFVQLYVVPDTPDPPIVTAAVLAPLQTGFALLIALAVGVGLAVMLNVCVEPGQLRPANVYTGVTVILDTAAVVPVFVTLNAAIFPLPLAASPVEVLLLAQL
jgi:hypothetical protein